MQDSLKLSISKTDWQKANQTKKTYDTLVDRERRAKSREENLREQLLNDEFSQRSFNGNNSES